MQVSGILLPFHLGRQADALEFLLRRFEPILQFGDVPLDSRIAPLSDSAALSVSIRARSAERSSSSRRHWLPSVGSIGS
ncbi:hypothetical protein [Lentisalinibacter salinarum]|uniref:hypothetical protein n=1 Tax=Lentisalinibacter salinarum TaxID=2992239 RepID=UPI003869EF87